MKRLLCIISSLNLGGAETFLMKLYRKLNLNEYQMDFFVNEKGTYDEEILNNGGRIFYVPLRTKSPLKFSFELYEVIKKNYYNYVFKLSDTSIGGIDLLIAKLAGASWVGLRSCNASINAGKLRMGIHYFLRPFLNYITDYKIAPSALAAEFTFGKKQVKKENVVILKNGLDLDLFKYNQLDHRKIIEEFNLDNKFVVGHIGRFSYQKNHDFLIDIFQEIKKKKNQAVLLLIGDGELQDRIRKKVNDFNLDKDVLFIGLRNDIAKILSALDVFVLPSFFEGMPNTAIEAQAVGIPCVLSSTITQEVLITDLVRFVNLDDSVEKWADEILDTNGLKNSVNNAILRRAGYDISEVVKHFKRIVFNE